eukprot:scaffold41196_cov155-Skeletonema_dohrnii-CCMP3373.AAC.4
MRREEKYRPSLFLFSLFHNATRINKNTQHATCHVAIPSYLVMAAAHMKEKRLLGRRYCSAYSS